MKKIIWIISCMTLIFAGCSLSSIPESWQVKGKLTNGANVTMVLMDINAQPWKVVDSVQTDENGEFYFTKHVPEKGFYNIQISQGDMKPAQSAFATVAIDSNEHIVFEADFNNIGGTYTVSGSPDSEVLLEYNRALEKNYKALDLLSYRQDSLRQVFQAYINANPSDQGADSLSQILEPMFNKYSDEYKILAGETAEYSRQFINKNTHSFACLAALQVLSVSEDTDYFKKVIDALLSQYPNIENLKRYKEYIDKQSKLQVGQMAPEITMNDPAGNQRSLSSLRGKVVVVDFWASWCQPCRAENPFVTAMYDKYRSKGLEIFSVSLDSKKDAWVQAIQKDKLIWENHVSDLMQWRSPVVSLYGFEAIPFTCVLDREGKIVAKNLRGPGLEQKVAELLN